MNTEEVLQENAQLIEAEQDRAAALLGEWRAITQRRMDANWTPAHA